MLDADQLINLFLSINLRILDGEDVLSVKRLALIALIA